MTPSATASDKAAKPPLEYIAKRLDEAESTANDLFLDLIQGKVVSADGANILLTVRALCLNSMHFSAQNIRAALESTTPDESLKALSEDEAVEAIWKNTQDVTRQQVRERVVAPIYHRHFVIADAKARGEPKT